MDTTNANTALASALVEELARCGVGRAVVSPGSRSTPLALALWRAAGVEVSVCVDERCAGFFALGAAQASGRPVVVLCTSGSAAANLHPAVVEADESGVPLVVMTADRPPELRGIGAGQTIDQVKLYGSAVRWFCEVGVQEADDEGLLHMRTVGCRAYALAKGDSRPGPVHLNLAWREPLAPVAVPGAVTANSPLALEGRGERPLTAVAGGPGEPAAALDEIAEWIGQHPRGLIVAGRQTDPGLAAPVAALAAAAGYPILAEPTSQLRFGPHERDLVVWAYDAIARARRRPEGLEPTLVLRFGEMPTSKALRGWLASWEGARQVVVDSTGRWNDPGRRAETIVRAAPVAVAAGLAGRLDRRAGSEWAAGWLKASAAAAEAIEAELEAIDELTEPGIHAALGRLYPAGSLVYTASSMPIRDQEAFLPGGEAAVTFLANRGANGIDGLISSAAGAAAASGRRTFAVVGDLALYHDMNGLLALRDGSAPVSVVVLNNGGGGIFEFLPQADLVEEFEELFGTPTGLDLEKVASLYGLEYRRVEHLADLAEALSPTPALIEIPVDRKRNVEVHDRLFAAAAGSLVEA